MYLPYSYVEIIFFLYRYHKLKMVVCFLCFAKVKDFSALKCHFTIIHSGHKCHLYKCVEGNCLRSFHILSSFKKHFMREHYSELTRCESLEKRSRIINTVAVGNSKQCTSQKMETDEHSDVIFRNQNPSQFQAPTAETLCVDVNKSLAILISSLYANMQLPRNIVQNIFSDLNNFIGDSLTKAITTIVSKMCVDGVISPSTSKLLIENVQLVLTSSASNMSSEHKRIAYLNSMGCYIPPKKIVIGQRLEQVKRGEVMRMQSVESECQFIPLREVLRKFFSIENILCETLEYMKTLSESNLCTENFIQGSFWRSRTASHSNRLVIPLFMGYDDYETGNVLGSHSGIHKLGAAYISIPCLPPSRSSNLGNIFLALLFHSSDRKKFGNRVVFQPLIDEFNLLSQEGIFIETSFFVGQIYFELALIVGDNLGIHSITGFIESFSANFSCRVCKVTKQLLQVQCYEDKALLRDNIGYETDVVEKNPSATGISERCVWLNVNGFNLFEQLAVDALHDILEGVAKYIICFLLVEYIRTYKLFSISILNSRLEHFDYGPDNRNKPCSLSIDHLLNNNVRLTASEMLTFVRFFGLLVGEYVPRQNNLWIMYITLRKILDIVFCRSIVHGTENLIQTLVAELNEMYLRLAKKSLKPKFHNLVHYHRALVKYGPLVNIWTMRFEAKHRHFKMAARASMNRRNLCKTLAIKHQLQFSHMILTGKLSNILSTGPTGKMQPSELMYVQSYLELDCGKSLTVVSWANKSSVRYEKGSVLAAGVSDNGYLVNFFTVEKIYLYGSEELIFSGKRLRTISFDDHFYAYEVEKPSPCENTLVFHKYLLSPIPNTISVLTSGQHYVVLRS